jgi:flagellar basal-body rod protein FlgF
VNSGLYAACTALIARTQSLELAAHNLANVNTAGYKAQQSTFRSILLGSGDASPINRAVNDFAVLGGSHLNLGEGNIERTGNDLDLAIEGPGFLTVKTGAGTRYTRNGRLQLSANRTLVTSEGDTVLSDQGQPLRIPEGSVAIAADGTISVNGAVTGKLKLVEFAPGTALSSEGGSYYSAPVGAESPSRSSVLRQGSIESSNVSPVESAIGLIVLQRHAETLQRALSMFHTDFNRLAAEELPKV